jgi:hypothetical protein
LPEHLSTPLTRVHAIVIFAGAVVSLSAATTARGGQDAVVVPLSERARGAERVIVGRVAAVNPSWRVNEFGDRLIISMLRISVDETLKGPAQPNLDVEVEGGTIAGLTLHVSDQEPLAPGDRGVFYLERTTRGVFVPHLRGQGFLRLDRTDRVPNSSLTLDEIRRTVATAQGR